MTASRADNKRVVLVDGFAGRGRYPDSRPASGEQLLLAAQKARRSANVEVVLIEQNRKDFTELAHVTGEYRSRGIRASAFLGDIEDHLNTVLQQAAGVPLFLFLDPCGANLPYQTLATTLGGARLKQWPATEALLNISADLTRRAAGVVNSGQTDHKVVARLDTMCGGTWWQQVALREHARSRNGNWETAAEVVVSEYANRLAQVTKMEAVVVPVRRQQHHQPVYHLVFLTRREHGLWIFGDALASARQRWLKFLGPDPADTEAMLFDPIVGQIDGEQERAFTQIRENLLKIANTQVRTRLVDRTREVFGSYYGIATEAVVRRAARQLKSDDCLQLDAAARHARDWTIWS